MIFNKETDMKFCENKYYDLLQFCYTGLGSIDNRQIHEVLIDEYNTFNSDTSYDYDVYIKLTGISDFAEVQDQQGNWFTQPIDHEWIKIKGFHIEPWYRDPSSVFELLQEYPELLNFNIRWVNHEFGHHDAFENYNELYSKIATNSIESYAQAMYELAYDL